MLDVPIGHSPTRAADGDVVGLQAYVSLPTVDLRAFQHGGIARQHRDAFITAHARQAQALLFPLVVDRRRAAAGLEPGRVGGGGRRQPHIAPGLQVRRTARGDLAALQDQIPPRHHADVVARLQAAALRLLPFAADLRHPLAGGFHARTGAVAHAAGNHVDAGSVAALRDADVQAVTRAQVQVVRGVQPGAPQTDVTAAQGNVGGAHAGLAQRVLQIAADRQVIRLYVDAVGLDITASMQELVRIDPERPVGEEIARVIDAACRQLKGAAANQRAIASEAQRGCGKVDFGHPYGLRTGSGIDRFAHHPHDILLQRRDLGRRQGHAWHQLQVLRRFCAIGHQRLVLVHRAFTAHGRPPGQLQHLFPHQPLFVEAIPQALVRPRRIKPDLLQQIITADESAAAGEAGIGHDQVWAVLGRGLAEQAVVRNRGRHAAQMPLLRQRLFGGQERTVARQLCIAVDAVRVRHRDRQRVALPFGAFGLHRLECGGHVADLRLRDCGVGDTGAADGDVAIAADDAIDGTQRRGDVAIEGRIPVHRILVVVVDNDLLAPLIHRIPAVVDHAVIRDIEVAVCGDDAGVVQQAAGDAQRHVAARQDAGARAFGYQAVARDGAGDGALAEIAVIGHERRGGNIDVPFRIPLFQAPPVELAPDGVLIRRRHEALPMPARFVEGHGIAAIRARHQRQIVDP